MSKHTEIDHSDAAKIEDLQMINADLLAALELVCRNESKTRYGDYEINAHTMETARAAIAKAKGQ